MSESIIKQFMDKHGLNQNAITAAANLPRNAIQRQVNVDFDGITMRTVKLLANVTEREPGDIFNELYEMSGAINDYTDDAGIYAVAKVVNGHDPEAVRNEDNYNLQQAIGWLENPDIEDGQEATLTGGIDSEGNSIINVTVPLEGAITYSFDSLKDDEYTSEFKTMWRRIMAEQFPGAKEL